MQLQSRNAPKRFDLLNDDPHRTPKGVLNRGTPAIYKHLTPSE